MSRVLVVSYDTIGPRMSGAGVRAYELSRALSREHEVMLACHERPGREGDGFEVVHTPDGDALAGLVAECDVVVSSGPVLSDCPDLAETGKVVIADCFDPLVPGAALTAMDPRLRVGDWFLVASERQRDLVTGMLAALGRVDELVTIVPSGLPAADPVPGQPVLRGMRPGFDTDDLILLWAGGIYEWLDPVTLIDGVALLGASDVKLLFMGTAHPDPEVPAAGMVARAAERAADLRVKDRLVFFNEGWVPYDDRVNFLLEADVGVSTHAPGVETTYSLRSRILDYVWTGLPVLCTEGDSMADLVARRDLGEVVPPRDPRAVAEAIDRLLDLDRRERCASNLLDLAESLRWDTVAAPLVELCRAPRHAADRAAGSLPPLPGEQELHDRYKAMVDQQREELDKLRTELASLRQAREQITQLQGEVNSLRQEGDKLDELRAELTRLREERKELEARALAKKRVKPAEGLEELQAELVRMRQEREGMLRQIDELATFREKTLNSLPYRMARRVRGQP